jgi:hypothetical protein
MITCPLCQQPVYKVDEDPTTRVAVQEDETVDFFCDTYVNVANGRRWGHYFCSGLTYEALIPPFVITLYGDSKLLKVRRIRLVPMTYPAQVISPIYEASNGDFEKFIKLCRRFNNLKVFS